MIYTGGYGDFEYCYRTSFAVYAAWEVTFLIKLTNDMNNKTHWHQEYAGQ